MKDFPFFTTEFGIASLILKEIPYRKVCYIHIRSASDPEKLLSECVSFCRVCGAETILATGDPVLESYPLHTSIIEMRGELFLTEDEVPGMFPVTESTVKRWRTIYNEKMRNVDNASTLEERDEADILASNGAYFIHDRGDLLGIGMLEDRRLSAIASVKPGAGELVCKAMQSLIPQQQMTLEVATTNRKAMALYERLDFIRTAEISRWYCVFQSQTSQ